jgi:hypothetical protein
VSVAQRVDRSETEQDTAQQLLDICGGDALMALRSVILDAEFLCDQLETASLYLSSGIARGWAPKFQR